MTLPPSGVNAAARAGSRRLVPTVSRRAAAISANTGTLSYSSEPYHVTLSGPTRSTRYSALPRRSRRRKKLGRYGPTSRAHFHDTLTPPSQRLRRAARSPSTSPRQRP